MFTIMFTVPVWGILRIYVYYGYRLAVPWEPSGDWVRKWQLQLQKRVSGGIHVEILASTGTVSNGM